MDKRVPKIIRQPNRLADKSLDKRFDNIYRAYDKPATLANETRDPQSCDKWVIGDFTHNNNYKKVL